MTKTTFDRTVSMRYVLWGFSTLVLFILTFGTADYSILKNKLFWCFGGYLVLSIISLAQAVNINEGVYEILKIFMMLVYLFIASQVLKDKLGFVSRVFVCLLIALGVYGIYIVLTVPDPVWRIGTMSGKNLWPMAQLLMLPFCFYIFIKDNFRWKILSSIAIGLFLFNFFAPPLTRSVALAIIITAGAISIFKPKLILPVGLLAIVMFAVMDYGFPDYMKHAFSSSSIQERVRLWSNTLLMCRDNPFGVGIGNWLLNSPLYSNGSKGWDVAYQIIYFMRPHNDFLWVLTEMGVLGLIFYISIFAYGLYYAVKTRNLLPFAGIVSYMVLAFFSFPKERAFHSMMLIIFLAIAVNSYHSIDYKLYFKIFPLKKPLYITVIIMLGFALFGFYKRFETKQHLLNIIYCRYDGQWEKIIKEVDRCSWFNTVDELTAPVQYYKGEAYFHLGQYEKAADSFAEGLKSSPNHFHTLNNYAGCCALLGRNRLALKTYDRILELWPNHEGIIRNQRTISGIMQ